MPVVTITMTGVVTRIAAALLVVAGIGAIVWVSVHDQDEPQSVTEVLAQRQSESVDETPEPIPVLGQADTLTDLDGWLNTDATSLEEIRAENELTIVQFWTFGCYNCKNTLEALTQIYADFGNRGVEIIGVHAPEFSYEADVDNIISAAAELGVTWPIALDTDKRNFHRWQEGPTAYWPRVYLIDGDNQIRLDKRGDRSSNYALLYEYVERLLDGEA